MCLIENSIAVSRRRFLAGPVAGDAGLTASHVIADLIKKNKAKVVAAFYDLADGRVTQLG